MSFYLRQTFCWPFIILEYCFSHERSFTSIMCKPPGDSRDFWSHYQSFQANSFPSFYLFRYFKFFHPHHFGYPLVEQRKKHQFTSALALFVVPNLCDWDFNNFNYATVGFRNLHHVFSLLKFPCSCGGSWALSHRALPCTSKKALGELRQKNTILLPLKILIF